MKILKTLSIAAIVAVIAFVVKSGVEASAEASPAAAERAQESIFEGEWEICNQYGPTCRLSVNLNDPNESGQLGFYEDLDGMEGYHFDLKTLVSQNNKSAHFKGDNCDIQMTYNPEDKSMRLLVKRADTGKTAVDKVFKDTDKMKYVVATDDCDIMSEPGGKGKLLAKAKKGDCLPLIESLSYFDKKVTLPDGNSGYMFGQMCGSDPFNRESFSKEWVTMDENAQITLEFEKIGNGLIKVIETTMFAPQPNGSIRMAGVMAYIGKPEANRLVLTKKGWMDVAVSDNPDDFDEMEMPEEIKYIPVIYDGILYDGKAFHASMMDF
ncbi:MAG: hypothetical protein NC453_16990 [Muribaculum sp.]|nr:hypothetical protein [Muribaculum sp.]